MTIIDELSPAAKEILYKYHYANVGILHLDGSILSGQLPRRAYTISVYAHDTKFPIIANGVSVHVYNTLSPVPLSSFGVYVTDNPDSGSLLGALRVSSSYYLFKPHNADTFSEYGSVKYDKSGIIKLTEPYSFLHGGGRKY
jgi:hypothetical protein